MGDADPVTTGGVGIDPGEPAVSQCDGCSCDRLSLVCATRGIEIACGDGIRSTVLRFRLWWRSHDAIRGTDKWFGGTRGSVGCECTGRVYDSLCRGRASYPFAKRCPVLT
eukprot:3938189-Rhodomonas_salina.1